MKCLNVREEDLPWWEEINVLELDEDWKKLQMQVGVGKAVPVSLTFIFSLGRVVKEEISDDNARLPCFNGRVVSWVSGLALKTSPFGTPQLLQASACAHPSQLLESVTVCFLTCLFFCVWPCTMWLSQLGIEPGLESESSKS